MNKMYKKTIFILIATLFLLSSLTVIALSKDGVDYSKKEIRIAFCDALTGTYGDYGLGDLKGVKVAIDEINKEGGIKSGPLEGFKLKLDIYDDKGDPKESASIARKIGIGDYLCLVGQSMSSSSVSAAPVCYRVRLPYIVGWASATTLTHQGFDNLIRETYTTEAEAKAMVKTLHDYFGVKKISIVVENGDYGQQLLEIFQKETPKFGIEIACQLSIVPGQDIDFGAILLKAKAEKPEMLVILAQYNESGMIVKQTRKMGWEIPIYGTKACGEPKFFELAGELGEFYLICSSSIDTDNPYVKNFLSNWYSAYDSTPEMAAIYGYDGVKIAAGVIEMGGVDRESFIKNLYKVKLPGIGNPIYEFDERGDVKVPNLTTVAGKKFKEEHLKVIDQ